MNNQKYYINSLDNNKNNPDYIKELYNKLREDVKTTEKIMIASIGAIIASVGGDVFDIISKVYESGLDMSILSSSESLPLGTILSILTYNYFTQKRKKYIETGKVFPEFKGKHIIY